jgi:dipeptidyl aminopeptidase/acylaminoacyl peptidase
MTHRADFCKRMCLWMLAALLPAASAASAAPPPPEHFTRADEIADVAISPSGKRLALRMTGASGTHVAAVVDLDTLLPAKVAAAFEDADITTLRWVNDERLVFEASQPRVRVSLDGYGTFAVNHDGSGMRRLSSARTANFSTGTAVKERTLDWRWRLYRTLADGSDDVLMQQWRFDSIGDDIGRTLARLNTRTGELTNLSDGMPEGAYGWLADGKGLLRAVLTRKDGRRSIYWRAQGQREWSLLHDSPLFGDTVMTGLHQQPDGSLVVLANPKRDTQALYRFDPLLRKLDDEPLVALDRFDVDDSLEIDDETGFVVGVHLTADRPLSVWFDERLATIQKAVDAALPQGRFNRLHCGRCSSTQRFVVASHSDRQPLEYYVYDHQKLSLKRVGVSRPWITEDQQGRRTYHTVKARDGLVIPVFVTHPVGPSATDRLPTIVLIHGGPWVRGTDLGWDAEAQFLASRGYRVLQPEFRGSAGFGARHFEAGWKNWSSTMQDDVKDVVDWAAAQQLTDPARVCLYGGSYGGYAALMGTVRYPQAYRCAASFVGVTDLQLMYTSDRSDITVQSKRYSMPTLIGDPKADADLLRTSSPIHRVAEIKVPLLLAHGTLDRRVPIEHAQAFAKAAEKAGVKLEVVTYPEEGHGWIDAKNHTDFLNRLETFFARSLAP